ncbi:MAG: MotA/TolQ/ExbB proton channel family protein [Verrucomicrobiae bacterium]|nr:MotA/TolQ/ExbB proton channel family protein [Verrucomicrobiae bacterium]
MKKLLFSFLAFATTVMAAPGGNPAPVTTNLTLWEMLVHAGWVMYPLALVSFLVVVLIIYYSFTLRASRITTHAFAASAEAAIQEGNFAKLLETAQSSPQVVARVVEAAATFIQANPGADLAAVREVAQAEGNRQAAALHQEVIYLMDLGVLAPMLGLFGTVVGILRSFGSIASEATPMRTMLLAGGVSQALIATAAGLIIGITAMFFYSIFRGRSQSLISQLENASTNLIARLGLKLKNVVQPSAVSPSA